AEHECTVEPAVAAMGAIVVERMRVDDAAAREGEARLPRQKWDAFGPAEMFRMRTAGEEPGVEQAPDVRLGDRAVGDAARAGLALDNRPEPVQPARAGADDFDPLLAQRRFGRDGARNVLGADRERTGVARHEQAGHR